MYLINSISAGGGGGVEFTPLQVFLSLFPQISTEQLHHFVFNFLLWKHALIKNEEDLWKAVDTFFTIFI